MSELVVKAKIKELAKIDNKMLNVSLDFYDAINKKVEGMIIDCCKRARANGRNTVMGKDV
jgi:histone H3/H4